MRTWVVVVVKEHNICSEIYCCSLRTIYIYASIQQVDVACSRYNLYMVVGVISTATKFGSKTAALEAAVGYHCYVCHNTAALFTRRTSTTGGKLRRFHALPKKAGGNTVGSTHWLAYISWRRDRDCFGIDSICITSSYVTPFTRPPPRYFPVLLIL